MMTASNLESLFGIKPNTIRQWAARGHIPRPHLLTPRCALYNPFAVLAHALKRTQSQ